MRHGRTPRPPSSRGKEPSSARAPSGAEVAQPAVVHQASNELGGSAEDETRQQRTFLVHFCSSKAVFGASLWKQDGYKLPATHAVPHTGWRAAGVDVTVFVFNQSVIFQAGRQQCQADVD